MTQAVTKPRQRGDLQRVPSLSPEDELAGDVRATIDIANALYKALASVELDEVRGALGRVEGWIDGADDLERQIESVGRQSRVGEIANQVGLLVAGFPGADRQHPAFVKLLCQDVAGEEISIGALTLAVRRLRRTWKPDFGRHLPSIAEVLAMVATCEGELATAQRGLAALRTRLPELQRHHQRLVESRARWREQTAVLIRRALEYKDATKRGLSPLPPFEEFNPSWPADLVEEVKREIGGAQT